MARSARLSSRGRCSAFLPGRDRGKTLHPRRDPHAGAAQRLARCAVGPRRDPQQNRRGGRLEPVVAPDRHGGERDGRAEGSYRARRRADRPPADGACQLHALVGRGGALVPAQRRPLPLRGGALCHRGQRGHYVPQGSGGGTR